MSKIAVVLFNLGGPDSLESVKPFLFNLFNDRAIIDLPQPFRKLLAKWITAKRFPITRAIYQRMGGKSPILELTMAQAEALEQQLKGKATKGDEYKTFVCMRYWHPMSDVVVRKVKAYAPDHVLLLPLYPHFSTATTESSFLDWETASQYEGLRVPVTQICCYPAQRGFIAAHVKLIKDMYWKAAEHGKPRVLFSAHGLPEKIIRKGDPYQWQIEKTVASITQILAIEDLDYTVCYQSRVGLLKWVGPPTEEEVIQAGRDKVPVLVVPIAFVSEHSETLVELDIDYRKLAEARGVPGYYRAPALGTEPLFIEALGDLCVNADRKKKICSFDKQRSCPKRFSQCPCSVVL